MDNYEEIRRFVREEMSFDKSGHGYKHAFRVFVNAQKILKKEKGDEKIVLTAALIHDCVDKKLFKDVEKQILRVEEFLRSLNYSQKEIDEIKYIITHISWNNGANVQLNSLNAMIVRDADRLEAIGAIGIIRTIEYGVSIGRDFYDDENFDSDGNIDKITGSTLSHFYEKLLLLKDLMHTPTAKKIAQDRHEFMEKFLQQFYKELF